MLKGSEFTSYFAAFFDLEIRLFFLFEEQRAPRERAPSSERRLEGKSVKRTREMFFFSGAADEGLPRKRRKVRMKEKIETTSGGMIDAGILWTMTTYSAP